MAMGATSDGLQNIFELQKKKGANKNQVKKKKNKQTNLSNEMEKINRPPTSKPHTFLHFHPL